jgi:hypothetical protein
LQIEILKVSFPRFSLGYSAGGIAGWHISRFVSLNGELAVDHFAPINLDNGNHVQALAVDLVFSPFFHIGLDRGDIVIGPKIGAFRYASSQGDWTTPDKEETVYGLTYGFNIGVFGGVGDLATGVLLGYSDRHVTGACVTRQGWSRPCTNDGGDLNHLSATVAALF